MQKVPRDLDSPKTIHMESGSPCLIIARHDPLKWRWTMTCNRGAIDYLTVPYLFSINRLQRNYLALHDNSLSTIFTYCDGYHQFVMI